MCRWIVDNADADWLLICEDDVLFAKGLREHLERQALGNEIVTLFKPHGLRLNGHGFQRVGTINGLLALLVRREVLRRLIESPVAMTWKKHDLARITAWAGQRLRSAFRFSHRSSHGYSMLAEHRCASRNDGRTIV